MKRLWKIKNLIMTAFVLMSTIIVSIFLFFIANWQIGVQEDNLYLYLDQLSDTVISDITSEFNKMNQASLSLLYSNTIRDDFHTIVGLQTGTLTTTNENKLYDSSSTLSDMVHTILTGKGAFSKIVLYDPVIGSYTFGSNTAYSDYSIKDKSWYKQILDVSDRIITSPYQDTEFSSETTYKTDRQYISLIRPYYSNYNTIDGYAEVVQNYDIIFDVIDSINYEPIEKIVILDRNNNVVNHGNASSLSYNDDVDFIIASPSHNGTTEYDGSASSTEILHLKYFEDYDYKCLIIVDKNKLFEPINDYLINFLLLSLVIIIGVILLSLFISRALSEPIYHLYSALKNADITDENALADTTITTNILELNALWIALVNSHSKLRESMNQLIMVEQREVQSKMIALQSQMNPHFLYNSLSVLSSIIDEERNNDAKAFCENLSSMLRYVSSTEEPMVYFEEELEQTHTYLELMTYRYGNDLSFSFDIPDDMLNFQIPKLTVQALVENAVKYATLKHAPWHITIRSYIKESYWYIEVSDNGFGFKEAIINELLDKLELIKSEQLIPQLSLDGMGLINLLYRIKLHCKSNPNLNIENLSTTGCTITIGGKIIYEEDIKNQHTPR